MTADLPDPAVSPDTYDRSYYLECCIGAAEWARSGGAEVAGIYPGFLHVAALRPGETVVDIGTGRGELIAVAVELGASRAIGVEYAPAAVELARRTIEAHGVENRAEVYLADARALPIEDACADLVTLVDVVEHLAPTELERTLSEACRVLRPGGRVVAHTLPNRTIYDVTYRLQRALVPPRLRRWPRDPRNDAERRMHVNEQTVTSLRRAFRAVGFDPVEAWLGDFIYTEFVPDDRARVLYHRLASHRLTERLGKADIWARGAKPAG